jgi:hypothetical protein
MEAVKDMKIEIFNINFVFKKLQHITSTGIHEIDMKTSKIEAIPPVLAYIEEYTEKNGFTILNGSPAGSNIQIFLVKK